MLGIVARNAPLSYQPFQATKASQSRAKEMNFFEGNFASSGASLG